MKRKEKESTHGFKQKYDKPNSQSGLILVSVLSNNPEIQILENYKDRGFQYQGLNKKPEITIMKIFKTRRTKKKGKRVGVLTLGLTEKSVNDKYWKLSQKSGIKVCGFKTKI